MSIYNKQRAVVNIQSGSNSLHKKPSIIDMQFSLRFTLSYTVMRIKELAFLNSHNGGKVKKHKLAE